MSSGLSLINTSMVQHIANAQGVIKANDQNVKTYQDESVKIKIKANSTNKNVRFEIFDNPEHGHLLGVDNENIVTSKNNVVTYIPDEGFTGKDRFSVVDTEIETPYVDESKGIISIDIISPGNSNPSSIHELAVKIHVEKNQINVGEVQTITVTAFDKSSNSIALGSNIKGKVTYHSRDVELFSGSDGEATHSWNIDPNSHPGTFKVSADVSAKGYKSISDSTTFKVNNKGVHEDGGPTDGGPPTNQPPNNPDITFNATLSKIKDLVPFLNQKDLSPLLLLAGIGVVSIVGTAAYGKYRSKKSQRKGGNVTVITRGGIEKL